MKLKEIAKILGAKVIVSQKHDPDVKTGCGSDLMSDVLAFTRPGSILLTGLTTIQVIYTATTAGVEAVCFVRGKQPPQETLELAKQKGVTVLTTALPMFDSCGRLYKKGLIGCSEVAEAAQDE